MRLSDAEIRAKTLSQKHLVELREAANERCSNWPGRVAEFNAMCTKRGTAVAIVKLCDEVKRLREAVSSIRAALP